MARDKKRTKKSGATREGVVVDFTGVEVGQRGVRLPEGDYDVAVADVEEREARDGGDYLNFKLKITSKGKGKGKTLFHICSLQPQALFNLRATLIALGMEVPQKRLRIKTAALIGKKMTVTLADDEYEGRIRSRVVDTRPLGGKKEAEDEEDEDEEDEDEEDEDEEDEDEEDEDDLDDL
jgi:hypothetical protein